jgi:hypothetical protein
MWNVSIQKLPGNYRREAEFVQARKALVPKGATHSKWEIARFLALGCL